MHQVGSFNFPSLAGTAGDPRTRPHSAQGRSLYGRRVPYLGLYHLRGLGGPVPALRDHGALFESPDAAFDALVGDLVASLDKFKVGDREKQELLSVLGPMRKDIVEKS